MFPSFDLFGAHFYSYPLMMGAAWAIAIQIAKSLNQKNQIKFKQINFYLTGLFISSWIGAKLFYLWTADFAAKEMAQQSANFWLGGGFVFYGGMIFALLFTLMFAIRSKQALFKFNIFVPALAIGHGVGRLGCFLAGCCYGKETSSWFSIHMHHADRYPTQLLEAFLLISAGIIFKNSKYQSQKELVVIYVGFYSVLRFLIEFLRGDLVRGIYSVGLSTSQLISILLAFLSAILIVTQRRKLV